MHYIYIIKNQINNKVYIGQTNNLIVRKSKHKSQAFKYNKQHPLYNSMRKYGFDNFSFEILEQYEDVKITNEREDILIEQYQSRNREFGYNIERGGRVTQLNEETIKKLSAAHRGQPAWNKGIKMSEEFSQKMKNSHKNIKGTPNTWAKGKKKGSKKLSEQQIAEVKIDNRPNKEIAKFYNVSLSTVKRIKSQIENNGII